MGIAFNTYVRDEYPREANEMLSILEGWNESNHREKEYMANLLHLIVAGETITPDNAKEVLARVRMNPNFIEEAGQDAAAMWFERCERQLVQIEEWRAEEGQDRAS